MFRDIFHKLKIFFCDDDVEKIYIRDEIIELIEDMDSQIVVDTSVYKTNLP